MSEQIKPDYYKLNIKGVECDFFDVINAMNLSFPLGMALKYFRRKGDISKAIEDLEKSMECIKREQEYLKQQLEKGLKYIPF